jgi:uncharacterized lipoprotein YbaY
MADEEQQDKRSTAASLLRGEIILDKNKVKSFTGATVYIRLEDVTIQDASSKVISQQVINNVSYVGANDIGGHYHRQKKIEFSLFDNEIVVDARRSYAIAVHIDVDGNGKINPGDFINVESYPVITHGHPKDNVSVRVRQVTK